MKKLLAFVFLSILLIPTFSSDAVAEVGGWHDNCGYTWSCSTTGSGSPSSSPRGDCNFDPNDGRSISEVLKTKCKPITGVIEAAGDDYSLGTNGGEIRQRIISIANQIILVGSLLSVGAIVYAAVMYTIAMGEDERIKTAKNALKFGIIGFVVMLISFPLVNAIVGLFYSTMG